MDAKSFNTTFRDGFIELPFDAKSRFGKARAPVTISINGYTYRTTVMVYGGKYMVPLRKDRQLAARVTPGDRCKVSIALNTRPREVDAPDDLKLALTKSAVARANWNELSFTHKREHAEAISSAKSPKTRARRLRKILEALKRRSG